VQDHDDEFRSLGADVLAISFASPERITAFLEQYNLTIPVLADPQRAAYSAFGLGRAPWQKLLAPHVVGRYVKLMARGWLPSKPTPGDDVNQLGGDFVLDAQHRLVYSYRSDNPTDRPRIDELLRAVRQITAEPQL
jgi:peroxiredoxin